MAGTRSSPIANEQIAAGRSPSWRLRPARLAIVVICALALAAAPGCGGCRCNRKPKTVEQLAKERAEKLAKEEEERRKKKPPLVVDRFVSRPHEAKKRDDGQNAVSFICKPGHWTAGTISAKANNFDIMGDLETRSVHPGGAAARLPGTRYSVGQSRPVHLPKGQPKPFARLALFVPAVGRDTRVERRLVARKAGQGSYFELYNAKRMPFYQYHFVVLAATPESYTYLQGLDSFKKPTEVSFRDSPVETAYYRVCLLEVKHQRTALPSHGLFWTSVAYVLWDDADPDALTPDQQLAMLDWLHWGGQLIISGPGTLDKLKGSFLDEYLPASAPRSRNLTADDLAELSDAWTPIVKEQLAPPLEPNRPIAAVELKLKQTGEVRFVPYTGDLLAERRVGRGRVLVSAFGLFNRDLVQWSGFDGFVNGCLLRRPARVFFTMKNAFAGDFEVGWANEERNQRDPTKHQFDPRLLCGLHYFSRDEGRDYHFPDPHDDSGGISQGSMFGGSPAADANDPRDVVGSDPGSWNDFNSVAAAAREALADAAGIEVPERAFVVKIVFGYLVVLVPINWLLFRLIGRVEWAWLAAPVIALVCAVVVVRAAQLDIGFARSTTEISVVELQPGYCRAHVTRYTALYSSLSTNYSVRFEDQGAQILPFSTVNRAQEFHTKALESPVKLTYLYEDGGVRLRGLHVRSASTEQIHGEQMVDLGGPLLYEYSGGGEATVTNRSGTTLRGVGVLRKTNSGRVETAWVGQLDCEQTAALVFRPAAPDADGRLWPDQRRRDRQTSPSAGLGHLNLAGLVKIAEDTRSLRPGDVRLVGWSEETIAGMEIRPVAAQRQSLALVLAHLRYAPPVDPGRDVNTAAEMKGKKVLGPNEAGP